MRIWLDEPVPERLEVFWKGARELHPTWSLRTFSSSRALSWMRCHDEFDAAATWAGKSDVLRYAALWEFGGVYVDADVEFLRPFDDLLDGEPFAAWEDHNMICPTVMGAPPRHPAIGALLDALPAWFAARPKAPPNEQTGPYLLTRLWRRRHDVRLLDPVAFYPIHWSEKRLLGGPYPAESYAVHHWDAGWLPDGPPQR